MTINKVLDNKKNEVNINEIIVNNDFTNTIKTKYEIFYNCFQCGRETHKTAYKFAKPLNENSFICQKCSVINFRKENKEVINQKRKETVLEKYGVENVGFLTKNHSTKSTETREKMKATCLEKYGVEFPFQSKELRDKRKITFMKKYGADHPLKNEDVIKKIKETNLLKYGKETNLQNDDVIDKIKKSNLENYGTVYAFHSPEVIKKIKEENIKNFGHEYPFQLKENRDKAKNIIYKQLKIFQQDDVVPLFTQEEYKGTKKNEYNFSCKNCQTVFVSKIENGKIPICPTCYPHFSGISKKEKELFKIIKTLTLENVIGNYNDGKFEIDIFIPGLMLGFEFDGLYWHSTEYKTSNYHINKTNYFLEKGIKIIHIFEDEYDNNRDVLISMIKNKLNSPDKTIYGRKCFVKEITTEEAIVFINNSHIQGYTNSSVKLGLFFESELVSVMTFGRSRYSIKFQWELIRFCNKTGYKVIGGAGKLFKYFINYFNPENIVSYCDLRYFDGVMYEKIGMNFSHTSNPNYFYFHKSNLKRFSRVNFQKYRLKNMFENYDEKLTEEEIMRSNGYFKIFDCGNKVFTWNK